MNPLDEHKARGVRLEPFADGYEVVGLPARLIGVPFPSRTFFDEEHLVGIRWVACLSSAEPERRYQVPPEIGFIERRNFGSPDAASPSELAEFARVAECIRQRLQAGDGVLVPCDQGISRRGTIVGTLLATLRSQDRSSPCWLGSSSARGRDFADETISRSILAAALRLRSWQTGHILFQNTRCSQCATR